MSKLILLILLFTSVYSSAQEYRFNQYTTEDGISQNFIYSINQDPQGYLWVGTGEGLAKFDGKNFVTFSTLDGLAEDIITCSHVDGDGLQWFGHNEGGLTNFNGEDFSSIRTKGLVDGKINGISSAGSSTFFISQSEGLFMIDDNVPMKIGSFGKENFFSIQCIDESSIMVGTDEGLILIQKPEGKWVSTASYFEDEWISAISPSNDPGVFLVGMKNGDLVKTRLDEQLQFRSWDSDVDISGYQIQTILEDKDNNIWLGTYGQGLIKLHTDSTGNSDFRVTAYNEDTGLSSNYVQSVYQDREGNIWVGTFGAGLSTLIDDFFTFYSHDPNEYGNDVSAIWIDNDTKWFGVENGLIRVSPSLEEKWKFYNHENGLSNNIITSLYQSDSVMWVGTHRDGMYSIDLRTDKVNKIKWDYSSLQNKVNQLTVNNGSVWVATDGGLIVYNIANNSTNLFDTEMGLAHNAIKTVMVDDEGTIWMGTHSRYLYALRNSSIEEFEITNTGELEVIGITKDLKGDIWLATAESGIYKKIGKSFVNFSTDDGLKSNFCYALHTDSRGFMWVGHRGGLTKLSSNAEEVETFDHESGINSQINLNAMFLDEQSNLWIGSDNGGIKYDPSKDKKNRIAPVVNLLKVIINEKNYSIDEEIVLPYNNYRIQFDFIGISFKNPEDVTYKFKLEGYDHIFSNPSYEESATYGRIADGEYELQLIACNEDGDCSPIKNCIKITIAKPFWKTWWFYLLVLLALVGIVLVVIRLRVRRFKATQAYLENQLEIKTKEVVEKADKIEEINNDLTSSINYAQRIQSAILPKDGALAKYYPHSFIFFKPRDVVSGDFYFIREYEDKIIVGCCDCTGHGVPGAFMSMIGSTTLRNLYKLMETSGEWLTPEKVLEKLDDEIQKILHQQEESDTKEIDFFRSRDGMDLTLCEINTNTNEVILSAAKRHSYIQQKGEIEIIGGDKRGIGGGESNEVEFTLKKFQMNPGDSLYLFSDGYPDQFGGPDGRKLKLSGTKKIIEGLREHKKENYSDSVASNFELWQADFDQIDDVLFMGILF
jgi:ligand-binding sensor domain-containing protein/serine phosphatase RsbU (regulator of sigma subunit)